MAFGIARSNRRVIAYLIVWSLLALMIRAGHRRWPLPRATLVALTVAGAVHLAGGLLPSPEQGAPIFYETWLIPGVLRAISETRSSTFWVRSSDAPSGSCTATRR